MKQTPSNLNVFRDEFKDRVSLKQILTGGRMVGGASTQEQPETNLLGNLIIF